MIDPDNQVLIEGVLFRARYLGSTQLMTDGNPTKMTRMLQAQEAVGRIKVSSNTYLFWLFVHVARCAILILYLKFVLRFL